MICEREKQRRFEVAVRIAKEHHPKHIHQLPPVEDPLGTAVTMACQIALERGVGAPVELDLSILKRLDEARRGTGNIDVPGTLSGSNKSQQFIFHISDMGVALEVIEEARR
jgi:hypothetical protein